MYNYIIRRLLLMPITLFFIILVNFVIINLAPGEPVTITEISQQGGGATRTQPNPLPSGRMSNIWNSANTMALLFLSFSIHGHLSTKIMSKKRFGNS